MGGYPKAYDNLIQSVKSIKEYEFAVVSIQPDYQKPQEIIKTIKTEAPDILFFGMPGSLNPGNIPVAPGYIDVDVIGPIDSSAPA